MHSLFGVSATVRAIALRALFHSNHSKQPEINFSIFGLPLKKYPLLVFLLYIGLNCLGQITFQKTFGISGINDFGNSVQQTSDSGFIMTGYNDNVTGNYDLYLIKTDAYGNAVWSKTYGGTGVDIGWSVCQTFDGGYAVTGRSDTSFSPFTLFLIKTDSIGDTIWVKRFVSGFGSIGYSVQQTSDSGYIICGITSVGANNLDVYLIKTDSIGNLLWSKTFGDADTDEGWAVKQTSDGGYIITGERWSLGASICLIKTDHNGDSLWTRVYNGSNGYGKSVFQTSDGGYIIGGSLSAAGNVCIIKTDSVGNLVFEKNFQCTSAFTYGYSGAQTSDGGYAMAGYVSTSNGNDVFINKIDSLGNLIWAKTFGGTGNDYGNSIQQTFDGGYVIAGMSGGDIYLIKTDANGNSGCNEGTPTLTQPTFTANQLNIPTIVTAPSTTFFYDSTFVYNLGLDSTICLIDGYNEKAADIFFLLSPNPASLKLLISTSAKISQLKIFDLIGKEFLSQTISGYKKEIDIRFLSSGIYFLDLQTEQGIIVKKFIKE